MRNQKFNFAGWWAMAVLAALGIPTAQAQTNWNAVTSGNWSDTTKWTPATAPDGASAIATFNQNWAGQIVTVDGTYTVGQVLATDTTANGGLTISGGTLILNNGANAPILSTGNNNAFGESAANRLKISSVLDGSNGFERQGNGYLDISGVNNLFTGTVKLTAPASGGGSFTVINNDANLGNAANPITVALSSQPVGFYNDAAAGAFTLNSARTITTSGTGDFWVKNKAGANMTIAGVISGTARFRKNDSGTVTLTGANTYTGNTLLDGGTLALSGGDNRLLSGSTVTFNSASTLDVGNTTQTLNGLGLLGAGQVNTIKGSGGTLILQGSGDYTVNTTVTGTSLDMSGLSNFTFNRTASSFQLNANGLNVVNTVNLAKAGVNTISANNVRFGGGGNFAGQNVIVGLGQANTINAGAEFLVGYFQGNGNVAFQSGLTSPTLTVRGAGGGATAVPVFRVGQANSGNQSSTGILNLTGGSLDAIATVFDVGVHIANAGGTAASGTLTMPAGTVVADTLSIARKNNTTGSPNITGTFNQGGGTVTATTLYLGNNEGANAPNLIANYNLTGGTLFATTIGGNGVTYGATTVRNLNLNGGTLRNKAGGDLALSGVDATAGGVLNVLLGTGPQTIYADPIRTINFAATAPISGAGGLLKDGDGKLILNNASTFLGAFSINAGTVGGNGSVAAATTVGVNGTLAPGNSIGTLTFGSTLDLSGNLNVELDRLAGQNADLIIAAGITLGGTLNVANIGTALQFGDTFDLFTGTLVGPGFSALNLPSLDNGWSWDSTGLAGGGNGVLMVVPEPTMTALLAGGLALLVFARRNRG